MQEPLSLTPSSSGNRNRWTSRFYWIGLAAISAASLWLRTGFPLTAMPALQHDDRLFVRLAHSLAQGHWLGAYDNLTLAKGMFYPLFMALTFWLSIPLIIAEHLAYLAASALTAGLVRRKTRSNRIALVLFALLAFNPVSWNYNLARVIRQGLYLSLCLAVLTILVIVAFPAPRSNKGIWRSCVWPGLSLGLVTAAYWLTREEGVWLLPAAAVVLTIACLGIYRPGWSLTPSESLFKDRRAHWKAIALPLVVAVGTFTFAVFLVAGINYRHYGIFETTEFRASAFMRAHGAITRIKHDHWRRLISFPKDARQRAYQVSPAARELEPFLEGAVGQAWLYNSCTAGSVRPCDEVEIGWGMWELRDAVAAAGHYRTGADAMHFYDQLADQINSACSEGRIPCLPPRSGFQPPFRREYLDEAFKALKPVTMATLRMNDPGPISGSSPSVGPPDGITMFTDVIDGVYLAQKNPIVIDGWAAALSGTPTLHLVAHNQPEVQASIALLPSPDVFKVFPKFQSTRFDLKTDCPLTECDFVIDVPGKAETIIPLAQLAHHGAITDFSGNPERMVFVDMVSGGDEYQLQESRRALKVKTAALLASLYARFFPLLATAAVFGLLLATIFRRRFPLPASLLALGLGSATAVATYIVLMTYLKATADMNVATVLYLSPSSPFVISFTTLGLYAWYVALRHWALSGEPQPAQLTDSQSGNTRPEQVNLPS